MASFHIVAGLILLVFGRELFWVFVAVLGFVMGMELATVLMPESGQLPVLLVALVGGLLGAGLAHFFYRVAVAAAGFVAGGRIGVELASALAPSLPQTTWLTVVVAGAIGAILLLLVFDWALIVISSLLGASFIVPGIANRSTASEVMFIVLVIGGMVVQSQMMRRHVRAV